MTVEELREEFERHMVLMSGKKYDDINTQADHYKHWLESRYIELAECTGLAAVMKRITYLKIERDDLKKKCGELQRSLDIAVNHTI